MLKLSTLRQHWNKICEAVACRFINRLGEDKVFFKKQKPENKTQKVKPKAQGTTDKQESQEPKAKKQDCLL